MAGVGSFSVEFSIEFDRVGLDGAVTYTVAAVALYRPHAQAAAQVQQTPAAAVWVPLAVATVEVFG